MNAIRVLAPAKINFGLRVLGRRQDGYHEIESLVGFADYGDVLIIDPTRPNGFSITGPFASALADCDNLVTRAHSALSQICGRSLPAHIELIKNLPIAAGIGGGSSDAAACLRGLSHLYDLSDAHVQEVARQCGADVPACLDAGGKLMTGIGHDVVPVALPQHVEMVLVRPAIEVSTAQVFGALGGLSVPHAGSELSSAFGSDQNMAFGATITRPSSNVPPSLVDLDDFFGYVRAARNDLEDAAITLAPEIAEVLHRLRDVGGIAHMSGSGATCVALFEHGKKPEDYLARLASRPDWWVQEARLIGAGDAELYKIEQF